MSSGRFGTVELDLIDPEAPTLGVGGSLTTTSSWINTNRTGRLTLSAQDPGSGVRKLRLERRGPSATAVLLNETVACDLTHGNPPSGTLPGGACPARADRSVSQSVSQNGVTTFVATATDLSGESTVRQTQLRIDRQRPIGKVAGPLRSLRGHWTNRTDGVIASLSGSDALSGVARLELTAAGASSGTAATTVVCATGSGPDVRCPTAATAQATVDLGDLHDGRTLLRPAAVDLAGNRSATAPAVTLLLDRRPPGVPRSVRLTRTAGGGRVTFARPSTDGGSPIAGVEVRISVGAGALSAWRLSHATSLAISGRATRSLHAEIRGVDTAGNRSRVVRVDVAAGASAGAGRPVCRPGRSCARAPQRKVGRGLKYRKKYTEKVNAAKASNEQGVQCPLRVRPAADRNLQQHALQFEARNFNVGANVQLGDRLGDGTVHCGGRGIILVMSGVVTLTHLPDGRRLDGPHRISYAVANPLATGVRDLRFDCRPSLDGVQSYLLTSPGFSGALEAGITGKPTPIIPRREPTTYVIRLRCPSTYQRHEYEIDAWNDLAGYNPKIGFLSTVSDDEDRR